MLKYQEEKIGTALKLLNNMELKGIDNIKRASVIAQILECPEEEEHGGSKETEKDD